MVQNNGDEWVFILTLMCPLIPVRNINYNLNNVTADISVLLFKWQINEERWEKHHSTHYDCSFGCAPEGALILVQLLFGTPQTTTQLIQAVLSRAVSHNISVRTHKWLHITNVRELCLCFVCLKGKKQKQNRKYRLISDFFLKSIDINIKLDINQYKNLD